MSSGHPNKRVEDLERAVKRVEGKVNRLAAEVGKLQHEREASTGPQQTTSQEQDPVEGQQLLRLELPPGPRDASQSRRPWYKSLERWKAIFELVGIPFAIGYAIVTFFQWRDLRHNFEADERAWLNITIAMPDVTAEHIAGGSISFRNIGKSPITDMVSHAWIEIVPSESAPSFDLKQAHAYDQSSIIYPTDGGEYPVLLPKSQAAEPRAFTPQEVKDFLDGRVYIALYGEAIYRDQFGYHWTRFCGWRGNASQNDLKNFNSRDCVTWNGTGDGNSPHNIEKQPIN
jgi:hypothetical protein